MTVATSSPTKETNLVTIADGYRPGECNIGPAEIERRRRFFIIGLVVTVALLAVLVAVGAPPLVRFLIAIPAAGTAIGYLQVHLRFCVAFGSIGVFNFGDLGNEQQVGDQQAARLDRNRALRMIAAGLLIGLGVGIAAAVLPL